MTILVIDLWMWDACYEASTEILEWRDGKPLKVLYMGVQCIPTNYVILDEFA